MMIKEAIDRTGWGPGPWDGEPDREEWADSDTGLPCLALRNQMGNWCGYVGVPEGHPAYSWHYDGIPNEVAQERIKRFKERAAKFTDVSEWPVEAEYTGPINKAVYDITVHGRLTYSGYRNDDATWYFGFDCGHYNDYAPGLVSHMRDAGIDHHTDGETYRTLDYIKSECQKLAKQLAEMK